MIVIFRTGERDWLFVVLFLISVTCCVTIAMFPLIIYLGEIKIAIGIWYFFSHLCHQDPLRSLNLLGVSLPVCSRCLAIYWGTFFGIISYHFLLVWSLSLLRNYYLLFIPVTLIIVEIGLNVSGIWSNNLIFRVVTGITLGYGLGIYSTFALKKAWFRI